MSSNYFPHNHPAEVPGEPFDLSVLADFDECVVDWSTAFPTNIKSHSVPAFPKPDPDGFQLPESFETNLPPNFWYPPVPPHSMMASPFQPNQQLQYSQPPTPAAECQVSSTISPITSPFSPQSDFSDEPSPFGTPGQDLVNIGDINVKGLTEEQLVSLTARDLNRLCRDMPDDVIKQLKKRRRTLKNRGYAYNSRVRRVSQKNLLEDERDTLKTQLTQMQERIKFLERELDQWKRRAGSIESAKM